MPAVQDDRAVGSRRRPRITLADTGARADAVTARATRLALALLAGHLLAVPIANAQAYPQRPIRLIVPFPPGGTIDMVGRLIANGLSERVGQTVVVDNRGGAGGMLGAELVARSAPDGYTLGLCSPGSLITSPLLAPKAPYDARRDFTPISTIATVPYVLLARHGSGLNNVGDLLAAAKAKPGALNYGSAGTGSTSHLAGALFVSMAGIDVVHVPYKGSAQAATELLGGRLHFVFEAIGAGVQYVRSGRLHPLGVSTLKRSAALPEVATISEQGVTGFEMYTWHSICAPRGVPAPVVERLNQEIVAVLGVREVRDRLTAAGTEPGASTPAQLGERIAQEVPRWDKLLVQIGLRAR